jgi:hypothetical protein
MRHTLLLDLINQVAAYDGAEPVPDTTPSPVKAPLLRSLPIEQGFRPVGAWRPSTRYVLRR